MEPQGGWDGSWHLSVFADWGSWGAAAGLPSDCSGFWWVVTNLLSAYSGLTGVSSQAKLCIKRNTHLAEFLSQSHPCPGHVVRGCWYGMGSACAALWCFRPASPTALPRKGPTGNENHGVPQLGSQRGLCSQDPSPWPTEQSCPVWPWLSGMGWKSWPTKGDHSTSLLFLHVL